VTFKCTVCLLAVSFPAISSAAELGPETLRAWDDYIRRVDSRTRSGVGRNDPFLWTDQDPQRAERVRRGEILTASGVGANGTQDVPRGLIHHWIGAAFIPGVTAAQVFAVVDDYNRYNQFYRPTVIDAALLSRSAEGSSGEEDRFRVRYAQKVLFTSEVLVSDYQERRIRRDERRWYSVTQSTRIQEFRDGDDKGNNSAVEDQGSRYIWRIYCITRYEQRDGGVYVEQENIVLSRSIPISLRWLVEPVVHRLSRDLTATSLQRTREAVRLNAQAPSPSLPVKSGG
jgi:hypothetical protein